MERGRWRRDEAAVSDFVGTVLLVALVVVVGSVLAVAVTATLSQPAAPATSFALAPPAPGAVALAVDYREGQPLPLESLRLTLSRNESDAVDVPRAQWTTPDAATLRAGDRLRLALSPAAAHDEAFRVTIVRSDSNVMLADLAALGAATAWPVLGAATLSAAMSPHDVVADGATATRLSVNVSHPLGALAVSRVAADLSNLTDAAGTAPTIAALSDAGGEGDAAAGDGTWSASLRLPSTTPPGWYNITVNATDVADRLVGTVRVPLRVTANGTLGTGGTGTGTSTPDGAVVVNGTCYGCSVDGGQQAYAGTRITVPTSENVTELKLVNWSWDRLHPERLDEDYVLFRIVGAGVGWSVTLTFEEHNGEAYATALRTWSDTADTMYEPLNATGGKQRLPLTSLSMDLLHPLASQQWRYVSGSADPTALYPYAGVGGDPALIVTYMGQDRTTGNELQSLDTGIYSFDLVVNSR